MPDTTISPADTLRWAEDTLRRPDLSEPYLRVVAGRMASALAAALADLEKTTAELKQRRNVSRDVIAGMNETIRGLRAAAADANRRQETAERQALHAAIARDDAFFGRNAVLIRQRDAAHAEADMWQRQLDALTKSAGEYQRVRDAEAERLSRDLATMTEVARSNQRATKGYAQELDKALQVLAEYVDDEPCWIDHHGYCQTHGLSGGRGRECVNVRAKRLLSDNGDPSASGGDQAQACHAPAVAAPAPLSGPGESPRVSEAAELLSGGSGVALAAAPEHLHVAYADRGFAFLRPVDGRLPGEQVLAQESSLATEPAIRLRVSQPIDRNNASAEAVREASVELTLDAAGHIRDQLDWLIRNHYQVTPRIEDTHA